MKVPALAESLSSSPLAPPPPPLPAQCLKSGGIHNEDETSKNNVVAHEYETKRMAWRQEIEGLTSKNRVLTTALDDAITALAAARDNVSPRIVHKLDFQREEYLAILEDGIISRAPSNPQCDCFQDK